MKDDKINFSELKQAIAERANQNKEATASFLKTLFPLIEEGLRTDGVVKISGWGTFKVQWNEPRKSVDVNTGAEIQIEGYNKIVFVPETFLKEKINEPFAHLEAVQIDANGTAVSEKPKEDIPLQKLDEQAEEIKDLLADINDIQETEIPTTTEEINEPKTEEKMPKHNTTKPNIPHKPETKPTEETPKKAPITQSDKPKKNGWKITGLVLGMFVVVLIILYFTLQNKIEQWANRQMEQSTEQIIEEEITAEPISIFEQPRTYTEFITTEKLTDGSRLAWLSKKYYGSPYFWVYIYEANKDVILNPNHVVIGTQVNVPKLPQELIDTDNPEALEYARKLHELYVK